MFFEPVSGTFLCVGFWILIIALYIKEKIAEHKREQWMKKFSPTDEAARRAAEYWRNLGN